MRSFVFVALLLSSLPSGARADLAAEARFHDEVARRHYDARRFEDAAREFMVEQRLAPNPNILFNIALCFQQLHRREEAYMYFAEYLASDDDEAERRAQAERALEALRPNVALLEVRSTPPGAAVYVDRRELGQYGVTPRVLALAAGAHRVWVEREGYLRAEGEVTLEIGRLAELELAPEQILGRLRLHSRTRARVRVLDANGVAISTGRTPFDEALPPGTYQVEATVGEERWSEPLAVRAGATTEATAALRGPTGELTVTANQVGALVSLDGQDRGFTPQMLSQIPVGAHALRVTARGMRPYEDTVEVAQDARRWITVDLVQEGLGVSPYAWVLGGIAITAGVAAAISTGFAAYTHGNFEEAQRLGQPHLHLAARSDALNITADVLWLTAALGTAGALVIFFATADFEGRGSTATVTSQQ